MVFVFFLSDGAVVAATPGGFWPAWLKTMPMAGSFKSYLSTQGWLNSLTYFLCLKEKASSINFNKIHVYVNERIYTAKRPFPYYTKLFIIH